MRALFGFAALAAAALVSPAQAQSSGPSSVAVSHVGHSGTMSGRPGGHHDGMVRVHRGFAGAYGYSAYDGYGDFDGNRSFDPDKWNDWWHDRPDRAYPRWLTRNQDCARPWFSGDVLTC